MKFDERNEKKFKSPLFFISMATVAKFVLPIPILLGWGDVRYCFAMAILVKY
jgi:hypothetical protein